MRYVVAVLLATVALSDAMGAQEFFVGMRAGQASSRHLWRIADQCFPGFCMSGSTESTPRRGPKVATGVSTTLQMMEYLALEVDLLMVEKGMQQEFGEDVSLQYIELPILLRVEWPVFEFKTVHLFADGGPAPSQETACGARQSLGQSASFRIDCKIFRDTKRDFGWAYGGGAILRRPSYQVTLNWRRTKGTRDLLPREPFIERFNDSRYFLIGLATRVR